VFVFIAFKSCIVSCILVKFIVNAPNFTFAGGTTFIPFIQQYDSNNTVAFNFGQQPFTYTPPSGFVALNTFNL
jgi:hypothetical protein